jgi:NAD(P)-dependent dehydrogenase (short-subunit alcohol dehydrogenase family)
MSHSFVDRVAVVTGGTQGIGWALTQALAGAGAVVYSCGYSTGSLQEAQAALAALPWSDRIHLTQLDITDRPLYEAWLEEIYGRHGRLDILIHNAAFVRWDDVLAMSLAEADRSMAVGYSGMVTGVKKTLPWMLAAGYGRIVNVGSLTARIFVPGASAAYAATKAAIDAYTLMLQIELAHTPVKATLVRLGTVAGTKFFQEHVPVSRMAPLTRFIPALTPPVVATAVLRAMARPQEIVTLPGYMHPLTLIYNLFPRFSRWLAQKGGANTRDYGRVSWRYPAE